MKPLLVLEPQVNEAMDMHAILDDWKANAQRHDDSNFYFLRRLKMNSDSAVDQSVRQLYEEAFSIIDCIQCANCCKTISPQFLKEDICRITKHLDMKEAEFMAMYLQADEDGNLHMKNLPCPFLDDDNR